MKKIKLENCEIVYSRRDHIYMAIEIPSNNELFQKRIHIFYRADETAKGPDNNWHSIISIEYTPYLMFVSWEEIYDNLMDDLMAQRDEIEKSVGDPSVLGEKYNWTKHFFSSLSSLGGHPWDHDEDYEED